MPNDIVVAKIEWADYHQGEKLEQTFAGGDQYERYNFRRAADGKFYGVIPSRSPNDRTNVWTVLFVARHPTQRVLTVVGWYEDARFVDKQVRPEYSYDLSVPMSAKYATNLKYTIVAPRTVYIPSRDRLRYALRDLGNRFGSTTFIYARAPGISPEPWRAKLAAFVDDLLANPPATPSSL
jgi:hypothetical protein